MAVPKKRTSRTRRDKRRATHKISAPRLNACPRCHSPRLPHRVCPVCGTYAGREVIEHEIAEAAPRESAAGTEEERLAVPGALDGRGAERGTQSVFAGARAATADGIRLRV